MKELFLNLKQKLSAGANASIKKRTLASKYYSYMVVALFVFTISLLVFNIVFIKYIRQNMAFQSIDEVHSVPKINEKKLEVILDRYTAKSQQATGAILLEVPISDPSK